MKYRSEIDGLRALAVLPVILFHAGFSIFSGGFIGVDVFFVISGYLISRLILEELLRGSFSIRRFYARRARRILPALFFVLAACIPFAFVWMLPAQYEDFSRSLMAVVLFISNIFFWRESGYFATDAAEKPLLHTWSLGVEEQFYVLFPLGLLLIWRFGKTRAFYAVIGAAILSFILCEYASRYYVNVNFFLIPTRAWELFAGAICAFLHVHAEPEKNEALSIFGLCLLVFSLAIYNEHMRLPSAYTLAPVVGTALILLYATAGSYVARLLSWRPFVAIGLISYSAYLWHHPLFAFARVRMFNTPSPAAMLALVVGSLALGALTWRLVEQPFRHKQHPHYVPNKRALALACFMAAMILAAGVYGYFTNGRLTYWTKTTPQNQVRAFELIESARGNWTNYTAPNQLPQLTLMKEAQGERFYDNGDCVFRTNMLTANVESRLLACRQKYGAGIALIGDSHGINLFFVVKAHAENHPFVVGVSEGMCRPYAPLPTCYYDQLATLLEKQPHLFYDVIYEQAGWHLLQNARGADIDQDELSGLPIDAPVPDFTANVPYIDANIAYLSQLARYSRVTWLGPRIEPEIREYVVIHLGCDYPFQLRPNQAAIFKRLDDTIRARLQKTPVRYRSQIDLAQFDMARDFITCDHTYFMDRNHYSQDGEARFGERITLQKLLGDTPQ